MKDKKKSEESRRKRLEYEKKRRANIRNKRMMEKHIKQLAKIGKTTPNGKRVCAWEGCQIILSRYNDEPCCAKHQRFWYENNGIILLGDNEFVKIEK